MSAIIALCSLVSFLAAEHGLRRWVDPKAKSGSLSVGTSTSQPGCKPQSPGRLTPPDGHWRRAPTKTRALSRGPIGRPPSTMSADCGGPASAAAGRPLSHCCKERAARRPIASGACCILPESAEERALSANKQMSESSTCSGSAEAWATSIPSLSALQIPEMRRTHHGACNTHISGLAGRGTNETPCCDGNFQTNAHDKAHIQKALVPLEHAQVAQCCAGVVKRRSRSSLSAGATPSQRGPSPYVRLPGGFNKP